MMQFAVPSLRFILHRPIEVISANLLICLNVYFFGRRCVLQEVWVSLVAEKKEQDPAIVL